MQATDGAGELDEVEEWELHPRGEQEEGDCEEGGSPACNDQVGRFQARLTRRKECASEWAK